MTLSPAGPVAAVLAVVVREGKVLLVRRTNPPDQGLWGFPGGKIEHGETIETAAVRELFEETAILAEPRSVLTAVDFIEHREDGAGQHFIMIAVLCRWMSGVAQAGDDASEAAWFDIADLTAMRDISRDVERVARMAQASMAD